MLNSQSLTNRPMVGGTMKPEEKVYQVDIGGKPMVFKTGRLAQQAGGAVTVGYGESLMMGVATMSDEPREGVNFLPLTVDYEQRMYAGGTIPGSFFRREGRPTENAVLIDRLTDRPLRPLFPKDLHNSIQVIMYSFSADGENPLDILALNAASAALMISDVPWNGPIGAVRIGRIDGQFVVNPTFEQIEESELDLVMAGTREAVSMVEADADEIPDDVMVEAIEFGHRAIQPLIDVITKMAEEVGKPKRDYPAAEMDVGLEERVHNRVEAPLTDILAKPYDKAESREAVDALKEQVVAELAGDDEALADQVKEAFRAAEKKIVRKRILEEGIRPDGRDYTTVRPVWCDIDVSPRAHGSGLFTRGETQVMTLATLGTPRDAQRIDNLTPTETKRYIHHYNFPPFSVGEVRFLRGASRREIGHGALAERALLPMIPSEDDFPYTLRLVSEVLASNGSSSMASVCGSTLALMDTGVPIKAPVAGVAMGLVTEGDQYAILTDIQGLEDHLGDMDFKVAGTDKGITALQMDIKITGLSSEIMAEALAQAKVARDEIMSAMMSTISEPRSDLKAHVPRIVTVKIPEDKIGAVIGPGGETIRAIQDETGAQIDIEDDGTVFIATENAESSRLARDRVRSLTEEPEVGRIYTGRVTGVKDYGAFVEVVPGTDGLVHVSQLDTHRVRNVSDIVSVGDEITVMITKIDKRSGKIRLSRRAVLEGWTVEEAIAND